MANTNTAAFLLEPGGPWVVKEAIYYPPGPGQVVVKNGAVALNPMDWKIQAMGKRVPFPMSYPAIIGADVAGEIYEVGEGVTDFKKGDRVLGKANWFLRGSPQEGGFQHYTICITNLIAHLPPSIPFTAGCVLPLSINTASRGLYPSFRFALPFPQLKPTPLNKVMLVWGGSSSCGSTSIQLAVASGATVIATASAKNHAFVKGIGASVVLDYHDEAIIENLIAEIQKLAAGFPGGFRENFIGALDAIAEDKTWKACAEVVKKLGGGKVVTFWPRPNMEECPEGVELLPVNDTSQLGQSKEIAEAVWGHYVPEGLKAGTLRALPEPIIIGKGLEKIADGAEVLKKGVSARKVVVEL